MYGPWNRLHHHLGQLRDDLPVFDFHIMLDFTGYPEQPIPFLPDGMTTPALTAM